MRPMARRAMAAPPGASMLSRGSPRAVKPASSPAPGRGEPLDLVLLAVAAHMLVAVAHVNEIFGFLMPLRPAILTAVVAVIAYRQQGGGTRRLALATDLPATKLLFWILAWGVLSIPFSLVKGVAYSMMVTSFTKTVFMYVLMVGVVRGPMDVRRMVLAYMGGTALYAAYTLKNRHILLGDGAWRLANVSGGYDANDLAVYCVSGLPLALHFMRYGSKAWIKAGAAVTLWALAMTIVLSGSRGGFLATCVMGAFLVVRGTTIPLRWRLGGVTAVALVLAVAAGDTYWNQMRTILHPGDDYNVTSEFGRMETWKRGIGYGLRRPILGVGPGNFGAAEGRMSLELQRLREQGVGTPWNTTHNTYVQLFSEMGAPGLLLFLAMVATVWRGLGRAQKRATEDDLKSLTQSLRASMAGLFAGITFLSFAYTPMVYALLGVGAGAIKVLDSRHTRPGPRLAVHPRVRATT